MSRELRSRWRNSTRARQDRSNGCAHHAMVLALGSLVAEAGLLVEGARDVVEKRGRNLLALRQILRIALHHATALFRDQLEGTTKRHTSHAFPPIVPVDEDACDAIVGQLLRAGRLVILPVVDVRELLGRAVLGPRHRGVAVEHERRMGVALANETLLPGPALFALGPADARMEPCAPTAAEPHAVVLFSEGGEGIPRRGIKRLDRVLAHSPSLHSGKRRWVDGQSESTPRHAWLGQWRGACERTLMCASVGSVPRELSFGRVAVGTFGAYFVSSGTAETTDGGCVHAWFGGAGRAARGRAERNGLDLSGAGRGWEPDNLAGPSKSADEAGRR